MTKLWREGGGAAEQRGWTRGGAGHGAGVGVTRGGAGRVAGLVTAPEWGSRAAGRGGRAAGQRSGGLVTAAGRHKLVGHGERELIEIEREMGERERRILEEDGGAGRGLVARGGA